MVVRDLFEKIDPFNLPDDLKAKAENELNENPATRQKHIEELRTRLKGEKDLYAKTDDEFLLRFLRVRKFNVNDAFEHIKHYYLMKKEHPDLFIRKNPIEADRVLKEQVFTLMQKTDKNGCIVCLNLFGCWDTEDFSFEEFFRGWVLFMEYAQLNPMAQINGVICIVDIKDFGLEHFHAFSVPQIKIGAQLLEKCFPVRMKAMHMMNESSFYDMMWSVGKNLLKPKMRERFQLHGSNFGPVYDLVPQEDLPEEFEGSTGPMDNTALRKIIYKDEKLLEELKYGYGRSEANGETIRL